jgi:hypothetical protein
VLMDAHGPEKIENVLGGMNYRQFAPGFLE